MQYDRARLEQGEVALFVGRNLSERMNQPMGGLLHLTVRKETNLAGLAHFLECFAYKSREWSVRYRTDNRRCGA